MKLLHINRNDDRYMHPDLTAYVQSEKREDLFVLGDMIRESELFDFALISLNIEPAMVNTASNETAEIHYIGSYRLKPKRERTVIENMYRIKSWINNRTE